MYLSKCYYQATECGYSHNGYNKHKELVKQYVSTFSKQLFLYMNEQVIKVTCWVSVNFHCLQQHLPLFLIPLLAKIKTLTTAISDFKNKMTQKQPQSRGSVFGLLSSLIARCWVELQTL